MRATGADKRRMRFFPCHYAARRAVATAVVLEPANNKAARLLPIGNGFRAGKGIEWQTMNHIRRHENPIQKLNWPTGEKD